MQWGVPTDSEPIAEVVASLAWLARFQVIEANWSRVKIALDLLRSYKTGLVLPINFYNGQESKNQSLEQE